VSFCPVEKVDAERVRVVGTYLSCAQCQGDQGNGSDAIGSQPPNGATRAQDGLSP